MQNRVKIFGNKKKEDGQVDKTDFSLSSNNKSAEKKKSGFKFFSKEQKDVVEAESPRTNDNVQQSSQAASQNEEPYASPEISSNTETLAPKKKGIFGKKNAKQHKDDIQTSSQKPTIAEPKSKEKGTSRGAFFSRKEKASDTAIPEEQPPSAAAVFRSVKQEKAINSKEKVVVQDIAPKVAATAKKKKGLFSKKPKKDEPTKDGESTPKAGFSLFKKKIVYLDPAPNEINVNVPGTLMDVPTFGDLMRERSVTYPVREPFQYVNMVHERGETTYNVIEPKLTKKETDILRAVERTYDMLVNSDRVLVDTDDKAKFVEDVYHEILDIQAIKVTGIERQRILYHLLRNYVGYAEIDVMINDRLIEDISCNGPNLPLYVYHRVYESIRTNVVFEETSLNKLLLRLAQISGRHISILQPIRDAALPDGSRINMTMGREVTKKGATFTIRKFRSRPISPIELVKLNTVDARIFGYLWILAEFGSSILISGGTAAGKTTLLNATSMLIRPENKIVSIEDTPEINLAHTNWIQAITRIGFGDSSGGTISGVSGVSAKGRSAGDISLFDLLVSALRQRPEYIIVGEVRGEEAYTLFQAISVGHAALGTIHAASMGELLARVESPPMNVPRVLLANTNLVIFVNAVRKDTEKVRRIRDMVEILGVDSETKELITNTVFKWDPVNDTFEYAGRSFLIEKIGDKLGIPKEKLYNELDRRTRVIESLARRGITDYREVTEVVRSYYKDPGSIENEIEIRQVK